jgi:hypothetical protein
MIATTTSKIITRSEAPPDGRDVAQARIRETEKADPPIRPSPRTSDGKNGSCEELHVLPDP